VKEKKLPKRLNVTTKQSTICKYVDKWDSPSGC